MTDINTELINDIQKRLADIPRDVLERAHQALIHKPIQDGGSILYRAGVCLCSAELYEYRKTLFPPNSLVDPLTQGAPVLRNPEVGPGACRAVASEHKAGPRRAAH